MKCDTCKQEIPSISLIKELMKSQQAYNDLYTKFAISHKFIKQIVLDWKCDPNHAKAIADELNREELTK
jgi:hypothetical protein